MDECRVPNLRFIMPKRAAHAKNGGRRKGDEWLVYDWLEEKRLLEGSWGQKRNGLDSEIGIRISD